jgi:hypothetical protein
MRTPKPTQAARLATAERCLDNTSDALYVLAAEADVRLRAIEALVRNGLGPDAALALLADVRDLIDAVLAEHDERRAHLAA